MTKLNHIVLVVDRSGSMAKIAESMNEKIKSWIKETKASSPTGTLFTAVLFDEKFDEVYTRVDINDVKKKSLLIFPRGQTALYDAVIRATSNIESEDALIMIVTDGQENASRENTYTQVQERLDALKKQGCSIVYMSSAMTARTDRQMFGSTSSAVYNHDNVGTRTFDAVMTANTQQYLSRGQLTAQEVSRNVGDVDDQDGSTTLTTANVYSKDVQNMIQGKTPKSLSSTPL